MAKLKRTKRAGKLDITVEEIEELTDLVEPVLTKLKGVMAKIATELVYNSLTGAWIDIEDEQGNCEIVLDFLDKKGNPVSYSFNIMDIFHDSEEDKKYGEVDAVKVLRNLADELEKKRR